MIYVVSDIHGDYEKYIKIFETINLQSHDTLFVLGDVVDRGVGSMDILLDMMYRDNVIPILGNHEYMALNILNKLMEEITNETVKDFDNDFVQAMMNWFENGGTSTLEQFKELDKDNQEAIVDYLNDFSLYDEVTVNGIDYILVHAGITNFDKNKDMSEYQLHELIFERPDYSKQYFDNKIVITGHTPTALIKEHNEQQTIYKQNNHIAIDCGCGFGYKLAVYCIDTQEEFYI